jgi:TatA/E family protein of Tat protein translocase
VIGDIFQPTHLLFLLVVVLLVLGPKRLPEMARSLGRGFRDFRDAISGEDHSAISELEQHPIPPTPPPAAPVTTASTEPDATVQSEHQPVTPAEPDGATAPAPEPVGSQAATNPVEGDS